MRSTDILLARHGAFDGMRERLVGRHGVTLNAEGTGQAEELARMSRALGVCRVLSSPQVRAMQTAASVARECLTAVEIAAGFDEIDFGIWTGRDFSVLANDQRWHRFNAHRDDSEIPGGEPLVDAQRRVTAALADVHRAAPGKRVLVVSHAEIIRAALLAVLGQTWANWTAFDIGPGTVTWLSYTSGLPSVRAIGEPPASIHPRADPPD